MASLWRTQLLQKNINRKSFKADDQLSTDRTRPRPRQSASYRRKEQCQLGLSTRVRRDLSTKPEGGTRGVIELSLTADACPISQAALINTL